MSIDYLPGDVLRHCRKLGWKLAAAESCTGGMIASILTDEPGCSDVFDRGYVTYSNAAKTQMLGVKAALIKEHGAVSDEVARAMAEGALAKAKVDIAVAVTGIAGPDGGTDEKPVGLVHIACAYTGGETVSERHLWKLREPYAGRKRIRELSAREALEMMRVVLDQELIGTP